MKSKTIRVVRTEWERIKHALVVAEQCLHDLQGPGFESVAVALPIVQEAACAFEPELAGKRVHLLELVVRHNQMHMRALPPHWMASHMAESFADSLGEAPNCVSIELVRPKNGERFTVTIQRAEKRSPLELLGDAYRYIVRRYEGVLPDHACAECFPDGDIIIKDFQCVYHRAKAWDAQFGKVVHAKTEGGGQ